MISRCTPFEWASSSGTSTYLPMDPGIRGTGSADSTETKYGDMLDAPTVDSTNCRTFNQTNTFCWELCLFALFSHFPRNPVGHSKQLFAWGLFRPAGCWTKVGCVGSRLAIGRECDGVNQLRGFPKRKPQLGSVKHVGNEPRQSRNSRNANRGGVISDSNSHSLIPCLQFSTTRKRLA